MTSLAVLFALLALTAWLAGRQRWQANRRVQAMVFWSLGFMAWALGLLSKEHVAVVPLLILAQDFVLFRRGGMYRLSRRWMLLAVALFATIAFVYLGADPLDRLLSGYTRREFSLTERLMTESRVLWHYISLFFVPVSDRFGIFYEYPVSNGLLSPMTTLLSILAWSGVVALAWINRKRSPVFAWALAWFLAGHLIESTIVPLEIIFEHRMYLPSIGLALGTVLLAYDLMRQRGVRPSLQLVVLSAFLIVLGGATYTRNLDFRNEITLYRAELSRFPDSSRNRLGLALALNNAGSVREGGQMLKEMAGAHPHDFVLQQNWYVFLVQVLKNTVQSEDVYRRLLRLVEEGHYNPYTDATALQNLAELFFENGQYQRALLWVDLLLKNYPRPAFFLLKGICHAKLDDWHRAGQAAHKAYKRSPRDIGILYWYGKTLIYTGEKSRGCAILDQGLQTATRDKNVLALCQNLHDQHCR
jgi:tetratricopeptide (TPR) repeat protein